MPRRLFSPRRIILMYQNLPLTFEKRLRCTPDMHESPHNCQGRRAPAAFRSDEKNAIRKSSPHSWFDTSEAYELLSSEKAVSRALILCVAVLQRSSLTDILCDCQDRVTGSERGCGEVTFYEGSKRKVKAVPTKLTENQWLAMVGEISAGVKSKVTSQCVCQLCQKDLTQELSTAINDVVGFVHCTNLHQSPASGREISLLMPSYQVLVLELRIAALIQRTFSEASVCFRDSHRGKKACKFCSSAQFTIQQLMQRLNRLRALDAGHSTIVSDVSMCFPSVRLMSLVRRLTKTPLAFACSTRLKPGSFTALSSLVLALLRWYASNITGPVRANPVSPCKQGKDLFFYQVSESCMLNEAGALPGFSSSSARRVLRWAAEVQATRKALQELSGKRRLGLCDASTPDSSSLKSFQAPTFLCLTQGWSGRPHCADCFKSRKP